MTMKNEIFSLPGGVRRVAKGGALVALVAVANLFGQSDRNNQFDFALIGDVPYAPTSPMPTTTLGPNYQVYPSPDYNALISDVNAHNKVAFTVHVGDIKAGNTWCVGGNSGKDPSGVADVYTNNRTLFNNFANAAVFVPGDNEWTDCHRNSNGFYNPQERLAYLRTVFFTTNQSLGQRPITLARQGGYPENVTWRYGNIVFVALNQPGSNNNYLRINTAAGTNANNLYTPKDDSDTEYSNRNQANISWLKQAFAAANADSNTKALVIMHQANVFERFLEAKRMPPVCRSMPAQDTKPS